MTRAEPCNGEYRCKATEHVHGCYAERAVNMQTNHFGKTALEVITDQVDGNLARAQETAARVLDALEAEGFMVVSTEYVG